MAAKKDKQDSQEKALDQQTAGGVYTDPEAVPVQDASEIDDPQRVSGEALPSRSPALAKRDEELLVTAPVEPSRADTVLKDAGAWPTEAHKATSVLSDSHAGTITPEQSPDPNA